MILNGIRIIRINGEDDRKKESGRGVRGKTGLHGNTEVPTQLISHRPAW